MAIFSTEIIIDAPVDAVWEALADIGSIHVWNPGVNASHTVTEESTGLGAGRHCDLGGRNYVKESVVAFDAGRRLTMRIVETNLPFDTADVHFHLAAAGSGTRVVVSPEYRLKYGPIGASLDRLFVRSRYRRGMDALLRGLKEHVEASAA